MIFYGFIRIWSREKRRKSGKSRVRESVDRKITVAPNPVGDGLRSGFKNKS